MRYIHFYDKNGIPESKIFDELIGTLTSSIKTFDYFVNWDKANSNLSEIKIELNLLNSLIASTDFKKEFIELIIRYPNIVKALPVLLAVRENRLDIIENSNNQNLDYISFEFNSDVKIDKEVANKYFLFLERSGLLNLFYNRKIKNFVDYAFGVEVGLDSNGRKNRGGSAMETLIESFVQKSISKNNDLQCIPQANHTSIYKKWGYDVTFDKSARSFDFAVFNKNTKKLFLIETNFYNGGGSKLKSVCGEFKSLFNELNEQNIEFIWITDGKGWLTTKRPLEETFKHNNYVVNINFVQKGILNEIFSQ